MDLPAVRARGAPILRGMPGLCGQREIQRATGANRGPTSAARPTGHPGRTLNAAGLRAASRGPASARAVCRSTAVRRLAHMAADPPFCVRLSGRGRWSVLRGALFPWWNSGGFHAGREYPGEGSGQTESPPKVRRDIRSPLPPAQYAAPPPHAGLPTWLLTLLFAFAFLGVGAGVYFVVHYFRGGTQAASTPEI